MVSICRFSGVGELRRTKSTFAARAASRNWIGGPADGRLPRRVPVETVARLLSEAGFVNVARRDEYFYQPLLTATNQVPPE